MRLNRGRYWVFAFKEDNPKGGLLDLKFSFNTVEQFEDGVLDLTKDGYTHFQILDIDRNFDYSGDLGTVTKWVCKNIGDEKYDEII